MADERSRSARRRRSSRTFVAGKKSDSQNAMPQVTKEELAESNQELTETIQRLDEENQELLEEVKTGAIEDLRDQKNEILLDLRRGKTHLEEAAEAMSAAVARQKVTAKYTPLIAGLLSAVAVGATLWAQKAGTDPKMITIGAGVLLGAILLLRFAHRKTIQSQDDRSESY
jgi:hypothetical protein